MYKRNIITLIVFLSLSTVVCGTAVYDQALIDYLGYYGFTMGHWPLSNQTVRLMDDFVIPTGEKWTITGIMCYGFVNSPTTNDDILAWNADIRGTTSVVFSSKTYQIPSNTVVHTTAYNVSVNQIGNDVLTPNITFSTPITLTSGRYWAGCYPSLTLNDTYTVYYHSVLNSTALGLGNTGSIGASLASYENFVSYYLTAQNRWIPAVLNNNFYDYSALDLFYTLYGINVDFTSPKISKLMLTPSSLDFTTSTQPILFNVTLRMTDDITGYKYANLTFVNPNAPSAPLRFYFDSATRTSGNSLDGYYTVLQLVKINNLVNGDYTIQSLFAIDFEGNNVTYDETSLLSYGPVFFTVTNPVGTTGTTTGTTTGVAPGTTTGVVSGTASAVGSTSTGSNPDAVKTKSEGGSPAVAIALSVVGTLLGVAIIIAIIAFLFIRNRRKRNADLDRHSAAEEPLKGNVPMAEVPKEQNRPPQATANVGLTANATSTANTHYAPAPIPREDPRPSSNIGQTGYNVIPIPKEPTPVAKVSNDNFIIDYNELEMIKEIGRGAYGVVFKGRWRGGVVAIKQLLFNGQISDKELNDFMGEAALMKNLRPHVNVVQFLGITSPPQPLCIVTEFLDQGSLFDYIHSDAKVDPNITMNVVQGIAAGMYHLHREGIIHRDLAARNVLLGSGFQVKISDFGLSRVTNNAKQSNQTKSDTGPLKWMSPEAIRSRVYSRSSDVWSFGVTVWEIVARKEPYPELDAVQTALEVVHHGKRLDIPGWTPPILARVMQACFQTEPEQRPDFDTICKHLTSATLEEWTPPGGTFPKASGATTQNRVADPVAQTMQDTSTSANNSAAALPRQQTEDDQLNLMNPLSGFTAPPVNQEVKEKERQSQHYSQFQ